MAVSAGCTVEAIPHRRYDLSKIYEWAEELRLKLLRLEYQTEEKRVLFFGKCGPGYIEIDLGQPRYGTRRSPLLFDETDEAWPDQEPRVEAAFSALEIARYVRRIPLGGKRYRVDYVLHKLAEPFKTEPSGAADLGLTEDQLSRLLEVLLKAMTGELEGRSAEETGGSTTVPESPGDLTSTEDRADEVFVPTPFQKGILDALDGKALRTDSLGNKVGDRRRLFKQGGLKELRERGLVGHHDRLGYYSPGRAAARAARRLERPGALKGHQVYPQKGTAFAV